MEKELFIGHTHGNNINWLLEGLFGNTGNTYEVHA